ncbi:MAG: hypothetical protein E4H26_02570, partial [Flavobacteriales bacterium]
MNIFIQAPMETQKFSNVFRTIFLFIAVALVLPLNGCKQAAEKTSEKMIEESIGGDAKVAIDDQKMVIETEEGTFTTDTNVRSWPNDVPNSVPEFKEGKIMGATTQTMEDANNWMIMFEEVPNKAEELGIRKGSLSDMLADPKMKDLVKEVLDQFNQKLPKHETIKKFAILDKDFTIEGGELTPTLKVKRKVISERYKDLLDSFY